MTFWKKINLVKHFFYKEIIKLKILHAKNFIKEKMENRKVTKNENLHFLLKTFNKKQFWKKILF